MGYFKDRVTQLLGLGRVGVQTWALSSAYYSTLLAQQAASTAQHQAGNLQTQTTVWPSHPVILTGTSLYGTLGNTTTPLNSMTHQGYQQFNGPPPPAASPYPLFHNSLKAIEEAVIGDADREDFHPYDDYGSSLADGRYFDPEKVSLLAVVSFCVANLTDPEGTVVLFENSEIGLV